MRLIGTRRLFIISGNNGFSELLHLRDFWAAVQSLIRIKPLNHGDTAGLEKVAMPCF